MRATVLIGCCIAGLSLGRGEAQDVWTRGDGKQVRESVAIVDTAPAPATAGDLARESQAIVIARYEGKKRVVDDSATGPMRSFFTLEILEVIKSDPRLPEARLEVELPGGEIEYASHVKRVRIWGAEHLRVGRTYVLFLKLNYVTGALYPAYSSAGIYDITGGRVAAIQHNRTRDNAKPSEMFLQELRAAIK